MTNESRVQEWAINEASISNIRYQRSKLAGGYDFADTLHNIYMDYGYPAALEFSHYWNMYRRFGIAKAIVEIPPDKSWVTPPEIDGLDDNFNAFTKRVHLWTRLKGLDTRQRVGEYAGLLMRVKDGKVLEKAFEKGSLSSLDSVVEIIPLYQSQLVALEIESDDKKETFGMPTMYEFSSSASGNRNPLAQGTTKIHPSRIIIAAEGADTAGLHGISALEAPYNSLMDLRKIIGGGAEGFYKNAAQSIVFELKDVDSAAKHLDELSKFCGAYDDFSRNRSSRSIMAPGMTAKTLDSHLISPQDFFNIALSDVAAAVEIPVTEIIGRQTGRLASTEDKKTFLTSIQSRRTNFLTPVVSDVIDWLMASGAMAHKKYEVVWDDLLASSDAARVATAEKMSVINMNSFRAGGDQVFSEEEMRDAAGMETPEDMPEVPDETLDVDDNEAGDAP